MGLDFGLLKEFGRGRREMVGCVLEFSGRLRRYEMDGSERRVSLLCIELIQYNFIYSIDISYYPTNSPTPIPLSLLPHLTSQLIPLTCT